MIGILWYPYIFPTNLRMSYRHLEAPRLHIPHLSGAQQEVHHGARWSSSAPVSSPEIPGIYH